MYRTRKKKAFPPGTFIPTPARICAIIHLCAALTLLLWIASQPFMGDLFAIKSELLLYDSVLDRPESMAELTPDLRRFVNSGKENLMKKMQLRFVEKLTSMIRLLFLSLPTFESAWLFFSLVLPVMLLKRVEGAAQACLLLPIITLAYAVDNQINVPLTQDDSDRILFPTEEFIVHRYLNSPPSGTILEQQIALKSGWDRFLIERQVGQIPSEDPAIFKRQLEKGEFAFTIDRLRLRANRPILAVDSKIKRESPIILGVYLLWNCLFAGVAFRVRSRMGSSIGRKAFIESESVIGFSNARAAEESLEQNVPLRKLSARAIKS